MASGVSSSSSSASAPTTTDTGNNNSDDGNLKTRTAAAALATIQPATASTETTRGVSSQGYPSPLNVLIREIRALQKQFHPYAKWYTDKPSPDELATAVLTACHTHLLLAEVPFPLSFERQSSLMSRIFRLTQYMNQNIPEQKAVSDALLNFSANYRYYHDGERPAVEMVPVAAAASQEEQVPLPEEGWVILPAATLTQ